MEIASNPQQPAISMVMSCVWIGTAAGLVLHRHLHLMCGLQGNDVAGIDRAIIGDHGRGLIAMLDMDRNAVETVAVLLEHKPVCSVFHNRITGTTISFSHCSTGICNSSR